MLRSSAMVAARALRIVGASSRPWILRQKNPIAAAPINPVRRLLSFDPMPRLVGEIQVRGYARGRAVKSSDEEDDDDDDDDDAEFDEGEFEAEKGFSDIDDDDFDKDDSDDSD